MDARVAGAQGVLEPPENRGVDFLGAFIFHREAHHDRGEAGVRGVQRAEGREGRQFDRDRASGIAVGDRRDRVFALKGNVFKAGFVQLMDFALLLRIDAD